MNYNTVYVGMDVHKENFTFCAYTIDAEKGSHFQRTEANYKNVLKYLEFLRTVYGNDATSKRGSADLRKTLFQVMDVLIKTMPQDDPVYQFLDKKRTQGKPYYVYMTAGANKFLRIYYGRVKEYLSSLPDSE